jgi:hypothetical protein
VVNVLNLNDLTSNIVLLDQISNQIRIPNFDPRFSGTDTRRHVQRTVSVPDAF